MSKLLIFIGENQKFDINDVLEGLGKLSGMVNLRKGASIGAVIESSFRGDSGGIAIVRLSEDLETVTADGPIDVVAQFAVEIQQVFPANLRVIDMDYSFDLGLSNFRSGRELLDAIGR
jgi:hypothetical protein